MAAQVYSANELYQQLMRKITGLKSIAAEVKELSNTIDRLRRDSTAETTVAALASARFTEIEDAVEVITAEINAMNWTHQILLEAGRPASFRGFRIDDTAGKIKFNMAGGAFSDSINTGLFAADDHILPEGFTTDDLTYPENAQLAITGTDADEIVLTSSDYTVTPDHSLADGVGSLRLVYR